MPKVRGSVHRSVGIEFDDSEFLGSLEEALDRFHADAQLAIETTAQSAANDMRRRLADDHQLAASIVVTKGTDYVEFGTSHHRAIWREFGTGIFNPRRGRRIFPRGSKRLLSGGLEHPVRSVAGVRPHPFFRPALAAAIRRFKTAFK